MLQSVGKSPKYVDKWFTFLAEKVYIHAYSRMTSFPFETWPGPYPILLGHDLQVRSLTQIPKCLKDINVKDWTLPSKVPGLIGEKPFGGWTFRIQGSDLRFISRFFGCCWFQKTWPLLFEKGNLRGFEWGDLIDVHPNWWNSYVVHRGSKKKRESWILLQGAGRRSCFFCLKKSSRNEQKWTFRSYK